MPSGDAEPCSRETTLLRRWRSLSGDVIELRLLLLGPPLASLGSSPAFSWSGGERERLTSDTRRLRRGV